MMVSVARVPMNLAFRIANTAEIQRALLANELDLGIAGARFGPDELFEVTLGQDRITAIASPALLGRIRRLRIEDLARWPCSRVSGEVARKRRSQTRWPSAARAFLLRSSCPRPKRSSTLRLPGSLLRSFHAGPRGACCAAES